MNCNFQKSSPYGAVFPMKHIHLTIFSNTTSLLAIYSKYFNFLIYLNGR